MIQNEEYTQKIPYRSMIWMGYHHWPDCKYVLVDMVHFVFPSARLYLYHTVPQAVSHLTRMND